MCYVPNNASSHFYIPAKWTFLPCILAWLCSLLGTGCSLLFYCTGVFLTRTRLWVCLFVCWWLSMLATVRKVTTYIFIAHFQHCLLLYKRWIAWQNSGRYQRYTGMFTLKNCFCNKYNCFLQCLWTKNCKWLSNFHDNNYAPIIHQFIKTIYTFFINHQF